MPKKSKIDYETLKGEFFLSNYDNVNAFCKAEKGFEASYVMTGFHRQKTKGWNEIKKTQAKQALIRSFVDLDESKDLTKTGENAFNILSNKEISERAMLTESKLLEFIFDTIESLPEAYSSGLLTPKDFLAGQQAITNYLILINLLKKSDKSGEELEELLTKISSKAKREASNSKAKGSEVDGQVVENGGDKTDGISGEGGLKDHNQKKSMFVVVESDVKKESDK
jgi:hypothetical protein